MIYLAEFTFPTKEQEYSFTMGQKRTCYDTFYPFQVISRNDLRRLEFEPVTILYGGNGSGKTTALNVIAEKLELQRDTLYNRSNFYKDYIDLCEYEQVAEITEESRIITSDDVFDYMLKLRSLNEGIDRKREDLFEEYMDMKYSVKSSKFRLQSLDDYDTLKKINQSRKLTQSRFIRENVVDNVRERSNGESAFMYFTEKIKENGLYLLDEPENSMSPERQQELLSFLEESARFFRCQFIIATHSPFLLSIRQAKVYDLDHEPVKVRKWTELQNVRVYYDFFRKHEREFE